MGIYSYRFLNEGEQADAYVARKAKEEADRKEAEDDRLSRQQDRFYDLGFEHDYDPKYKRAWDAKKLRDKYGSAVPTPGKLEKEYDRKHQRSIDNQTRREGEMDDHFSKEMRRNGINPNSEYSMDRNEDKVRKIALRGYTDYNAKYTHDRKKAAKSKHESTLFESVHFLND